MMRIADWGFFSLSPAGEKKKSQQNNKHQITAKTHTHKKKAKNSTHASTLQTFTLTLPNPFPRPYFFQRIILPFYLYILFSSCEIFLPDLFSLLWPKASVLLLIFNTMKSDILCSGLALKKRFCVFIWWKFKSCIFFVFYSSGWFYH